jgi:hypothetical protein
MREAERLKKESGRFARRNETPAVSMVTVAWGKETTPGMRCCLLSKLQEFSSRHDYNGACYME